MNAAACVRFNDCQSRTEQKLDKEFKHLDMKKSGSTCRGSPGLARVEAISCKRHSPCPTTSSSVTPGSTTSAAKSQPSSSRSRATFALSPAASCRSSSTKGRSRAWTTGDRRSSTVSARIASLPCRAVAQLPGQSVLPLGLGLLRSLRVQASVPGRTRHTGLLRHAPERRRSVDRSRHRALARRDLQASDYRLEPFRCQGVAEPVT